MGIDQAIADLAAASSSVDALGQSVNINGNDVVCVKRGLTIEEAAAVSQRFGMSIEGMRISVDKNLLQYQPVYNGAMTIDGFEYTVAGLSVCGDLLRLTLVRYRS